MTARRLGVGIVGSGFIARFHMQGFAAVRDADVRGVWSPNRGRAESAAGMVREFVRILGEVVMVPDLFDNAREVPVGEAFGEQVLEDALHLTHG